MNIKELIQNLTAQLKGHNALIQIQVDGQYVIKHIGDVNKLGASPKNQLQAYTLKRIIS